LWSLVAAAGLTLLVGVVIVTGGGWDEAVRTLSGERLLEREAEVRARFETATPEPDASGEGTATEPSDGAGESTPSP
jgi:hypothetical protein